MADANPPQAEDEYTVLKGHEFLRLMKLFKRRWIFLLANVFATICGAAPMVMNILMGSLVTVASSNDFLKGVKSIMWKLAIYVFSFSCFMLLQHLFGSYSSPYFLTDVRQSLYSSIMRNDITFFDKTQTGTLIGRLAHDCTLCQEIYITKSLNAVQNIAQSISGIILGFFVSWRITLTIFLAYPLSALIYWGCEKWIAHLWDDFNKSATNASTQAEEVISSFRTVKSFDQELREVDRYKKTLQEITSVFHKTSIIQGLKDGGIEFVLNTVIVVFWYYGSWIIINRPQWKMETGDLMVLQMSLIFAVIGISQTLALSDDFKKARISAAKILEITDLKPTTDQREGEKQFPEGHEPNQKTAKGVIEFRNVSFKYESQEKYAVHNLSFTVNAGETVALIGESGCGKSTTLQLLQRFYEINEGQILLDGVDIKTLSPKFLRKQIAVVPQTPVLYSMSIKDNIRYSNPKISDNEIAQAAQIGNAHDFIMALPDNYETEVGPVSLSGGQKQRICISRAILANTPILLLDEATAALDTESEQLVQQSIESVRHGKTSIIVAHRLATVINSDRILVFKDGTIVEEGTHKDLLEKNGIYTNLVKYQLQ